MSKKYTFTIDDVNQWHSSLALASFLAQLKITDTDLHDTIYYEYSSEWSSCEGCGEPACFCECGDMGRYMREYDDGASLED